MRIHWAVRHPIRIVSISLLVGAALAFQSSYGQVIIGGGRSGGSGGTPGNPTATAGPAAINGSATTYMRSDAAPPVQQGTNAQQGLVQCDGTTINCSAGVISTVAGAGNTTISPATGNVANDATCMSNTTTTIKDCGFAPAPAGQVSLVSGSNPTITAANWLAYAQYTITGSGRTLTIPASSTLSANGGLAIDTNASSVTVTANAADTITFAGATSASGGSVTLPVSGLYFVSSDALGHLYISSNTALGSGSNIRAASLQGNGTKAQMSTGSTTTNDCVKFDANGNTVDAGAACGSGSGSAVSPVSYGASRWYWAYPFPSSTTGAAMTSGTIVWTPFTVYQAITLNNVGLRMTTAAASGNCQIAIYASSNGLPTGSALASTSNISTTSGNFITGALSLAISTPGVYWFGVNCDNGTVGFMGSQPQSAYMGGTAGGPSTGNLSSSANASTHYTTAQTFGTWPINPSVSVGASTAADVPVPVFEVASVP